MKIRLETWSEYKYELIMKEYGEVLKRYFPQEVNGYIYIEIDTIEKLVILESELRDYCETKDDIYYFGLMITSDANGKMLMIKDNYD